MATGEERTRAEAKPTSGGCGCSDPYAALPAELRPKRQAGNAGLRQTTCPICGLVYWTNRETDVCIRCGSL
jgi:hypothetical protein